MFDTSGKLRLLWVFMRGQRLRYFGAIAAMLLAMLVLYLVPLLAAGVIDFVIQAKPLRGPAWLREAAARMGGRDALAGCLWAGGAAIVVLTALSGVFTYLKGRWSAQASEIIARRLRDRLYEHLQKLPCSYHDRTDTGDLVQRCTSDVETVRSFLAVQVVDIARAILMLITVLPFMLVLSGRLTLLAMAMIPVIVGFSLIFLARVTSAFKLSDEAEGEVSTLLQENLTGIRVVRAFARQDYECEKFAAANAKFRDTTIRLINLMAWYWAASDYACHLQMALVLVLGGFWVLAGSADAGVLFAFLAYEGMMLWPVRQMGRLLTELGKAGVSMGRLKEILHQPTEEGLPAPEAQERGTGVSPVRPTGILPVDVTPVVQGRDGPATHSAGRCAGRDAHATGKAAVEGALCVRDLHFSYDGKQEVLAGVSFDVPAGGTVAFLGPSGAGKSTLMHVLLRLYPYERGSIRVDGRELRDLDLHGLRGQFGVVLQEPFLYSKSLRENIRLAPMDDSVVEAAAAVAAIHESILSFEKGYDTLVGERGVTLSGGQRQRVALARAILGNPPILILDDAFSAVDVRTESAVLSALRRRRGRRTTLLIAHRLTTLMQADRILVLEHGRITQSGTHQELLAAEGLYRRLWRIQNELEEDLRTEFQANGQGGCKNG